jgi:hypothetical protein
MHEVLAYTIPPTCDMSSILYCNGQLLLGVTTRQLSTPAMAENINWSMAIFAYIGSLETSTEGVSFYNTQEW